jgi:hypothetical protein
VLAEGVAALQASSRGQSSKRQALDRVRACDDFAQGGLDTMQQRARTPAPTIGPAHVRLGEFLRDIRLGAGRSTREMPHSSGYVSQVENGKAHASAEAVDAWLACVPSESRGEMRQLLYELHGDAVSESDARRSQSAVAVAHVTTDQPARPAAGPISERLGSGLAGLIHLASDDPSMRVDAISIRAVIGKDRNGEIWRWVASFVTVTFRVTARHQLDLLVAGAMPLVSHTSPPSLGMEVAPPWQATTADPVLNGGHLRTYRLSYPPTGDLPEPLELRATGQRIVCPNNQAELALDVHRLPGVRDCAVELEFINTRAPEFQNHQRPFRQGDYVPIDISKTRSFVVGDAEEELRLMHRWNSRTGESIH